MKNVETNETIELTSGLIWKREPWRQGDIIVLPGAGLSLYGFYGDSVNILLSEKYKPGKYEMYCVYSNDNKGDYDNWWTGTIYSNKITIEIE